MSYLEEYKNIKNNLLINGLDSEVIQYNIKFIINELNDLLTLINKSINLLNRSVQTNSNRELIMDEIKTNNLSNIIFETRSVLTNIFSDKYDNYTRISPIQIFLDSLSNSNDLETYFDLIDKIK